MGQVDPDRLTGTASTYPRSVSAPVLTDDLPDDLLAQLREAGRVGVDTETSGLDWRRDTLELCQFFMPETGPILVRISSRPAPNITQLLEDSKVTKVFHHAPFDLRFLEATLGARTRSVICTKAASKILDPALPHSEHSLAALLRRHFAIVLDKGGVRTSDWAAPELSPSQIDYGAADVTHLIALAASLTKELQATGLNRDFEAVCAYMPVAAHFTVTGVPDPLDY